MFFSKKAVADVQQFDIFKDAYTLLKYSGVLKINNPKSRWRDIAYRFYRCIFFIMISIYITQHWIYIFQMITAARYDRVIEGLVLTLPHVIFLVKVSVFSWNSVRLEKINVLIRGPVFAAMSSRDQNLIYKQYNKMYFYFRALQALVAFCGILWVANPFIRKYIGDEDILVTVFPFHINTMPRFVFAALWDTFLFFPWLSWTHISIDYMLANYYCLATTQLRILKDNIITLFDKTETDEYFQTDRDIGNNDMQINFVRLLKRYDKIAWYLSEINVIFNVAVSVHFFVSSGEMCLIVYRLGTMKGFSTQHILYILLLGIVQVQILMYCYYGELIKTESEGINTAVYNSDWLCVSPQFRKQLVIAMSRWQQPLVPTVASIVPLALTTYVSIVKTAYSIYSLIATK